MGVDAAGIAVRGGGWRWTNPLAPQSDRTFPVTIMARQLVVHRGAVNHLGEPNRHPTIGIAAALSGGFRLAGQAQGLIERLPAIPVNTGNRSDAQFQSLFTPQAMGGAAAQGADSATDRLANFYMDMAEQMFPVIEVDAGRGVEFILNKGTSLRLAK